MDSQTKVCQNCHKEFTIEPEEFAFYEKINVPPPTFCPECRLIRRMLFRNERSLYKSKCDLCHHEIIAMYDDCQKIPVYCQQCWFSDVWDATQYGIRFDEKTPFFEQFHKLLFKVPHVALEGYQNVNSKYANYVWFSKEIYLSPSTIHSENVSYSKMVYHSKDIVDALFLHHSEQCYEGVMSYRCNNSAYLFNAHDCINSFFLFDCVGCQNCFMSSNLRNQKYIFRNRHVSPEEYKQLIKSIDIGSNTRREELLKEFDILHKQSLHKFAIIRRAANVTGNSIINSKNAQFCFDIDGGENVRYWTQGLEVKDSMDLYGAGDKAELLYEGVNVGYRDSRIFFASNTFDGCIDVQYSDYCRNVQNLFGCVGLRHKQYCILNKQYTRSEYEKLVPKIIEHMNEMPYIDKKGRIYKYGEFFPSELSPFAYNETIAQEYFPLTKEQVLEQGYSWKEPEERDIKIDIKSDELPDNIHPPKFCKAKLGRVKDVKDDIVGKVIECAHQGKCNEQCTTAFKIIEPELQFYRKMNLPLPRLCPNCRHYQRLKQRNPLKLWHRKCQCAGNQSENGVYKNTIKHFHGDQPCPNEFETTYAPDRPEIVYCEQCYLAEVV